MVKKTDWNGVKDLCLYFGKWGLVFLVHYILFMYVSYIFAFLYPVLMIALYYSLYKKWSDNIPVKSSQGPN